MTVTRENCEGCLILWIDNPPVNALSQDVRAALLSGVTDAASDATIKGIVITCKGRTFIAGPRRSCPMSPTLLKIQTNRLSRRSMDKRSVADWRLRSPVIIASPRKALNSAFRK